MHLRWPFLYGLLVSLGYAGSRKIDSKIKRVLNHYCADSPLVVTCPSLPPLKSLCRASERLD
jgi:hypothetical protein